MANKEQLAILMQGVEVWNKWRKGYPRLGIDIYDIDLTGAELQSASLAEANLSGVNLMGADFRGASLQRANLGGADLQSVDLSQAILKGCNFSHAWMGQTNIIDLDLSDVIGIWETGHFSPSHISTDTLVRSRGKIPDNFLRGCGLSDWEIEAAKLYNPDLANEEKNQILYRIYDLQARQAIQISPLFISYSHADSEFVNKIGSCLQDQGVRYWRDIYDMKAGQMERQIDRAIRQNPTVLLVLSEYSLNSDWVEHEVRTARGLEKELGRDTLCPIALDNTWKSSPWPKRLMEQIMEYNILDFSEWKNDVKFEGMFRKLIGGLELFYKG